MRDPEQFSWEKVMVGLSGRGIQLTASTAMLSKGQKVGELAGCGHRKFF